jgi:hypothetical protein
MTPIAAADTELEAEPSLRLAAAVADLAQLLKGPTLVADRGVALDDLAIAASDLDADGVDDAVELVRVVSPVGGPSRSAHGFAHICVTVPPPDDVDVRKSVSGAGGWQSMSGERAYYLRTRPPSMRSQTMRRLAALATVAAAIFAVVFVPQIGTASSPGQQVLEFDLMAPVVEPFTGSANSIRGVPGGGLPWEIDEANGELSNDGSLEVEVDGLVLARRAPVPAALQGTNPIASFKAIVSCLTVADGVAQTVNVETDLAPATSTGDAQIEDSVELPSPCIAPIVFVTSPTGSWFAATGR